ncbi:MAG: diadenylate cyclase CdaA [Bacilli bacterium]|jgi:diadenylate cyclase
MTLDFIASTFMKIIDVVLVWFGLYFVLKNIRNNVKMSLLFKGIVFILVIKLISDWLGLVTIGLLLEYVIMWGPLALIIIFQPEIRNVLEQIGKTQLLGRHKILSIGEREKLVHEITTAVEYLKKTRIGALIVIERDVSLRDYIERSKKIYADITSELLIAIFFPNNPLHDGGIIIQGDKISCAGAVFPTSVDMKIVKRLGTRHRAALGISEETDCISIIVSEETGRISIATNGELNYNLTIDDFSEILLDELRPKNDVLVEEEVEEVDHEDNQ